jgi:DNA-binding MarR family transcriptional regulator
MIDDSHQQSNDNQIGSLVQDFLQIEMKLSAMLPKEIEQLQYLLDEVRDGDKPHRFINYNLFSRIIYNLYRKDSMTMGELSHALSVPFSTATRMIDWFVDNGFARRLSDPDDRRVVRVALTDGGRELYGSIERNIGQRSRQLLSPLTAKERTMFYMLMDKVVKALRDTEIQV